MMMTITQSRAFMRGVNLLPPSTDVRSEFCRPLDIFRRFLWQHLPADQEQAAAYSSECLLDSHERIVYRTILVRCPAGMCPPARNARNRESRLRRPIPG